MFTPQIQFWTVLIAVGLFALAVRLSRATLEAAVLAFVAAFVFTGLNLVWDLSAYHAHWWSYPLRSGPFLPLPVYFAQDLVWGGAFTLASWRLYKRFGPVALIAFILSLSVLGTARDSTYALFGNIIVFNTGVVPRLADLFCWITLLAVSHAIPCFGDRSLVRRSSLTRSPRLPGT